MLLSTLRSKNSARSACGTRKSSGRINTFGNTMPVGFADGLVPGVLISQVYATGDTHRVCESLVQHQCPNFAVSPHFCLHFSTVQNQNAGIAFGFSCRARVSHDAPRFLEKSYVGVPRNPGSTTPTNVTNTGHPKRLTYAHRGKCACGAKNLFLLKIKVRNHMPLKIANKYYAT